MVRLRKLVVFVCALLVVNILSIAAFAGELSTEHKDWLKSNVKVDGDSVICQDIGVKGRLYTKVPEGFKSTDFEQVQVSDGKYAYYKKDGSESFITAVERARNNAGASEKVASLTRNLGLGADVDGATEALAPLTPLVNKIVGLLTVLTILAVALYDGFDFFYVANSGFRVWLDGKVENAGSGNAAVTTDKNGDRKFRLVTDQAIYAVKACNTEETGKSPIWMWFKLKLWFHIIIGIVFTLLLTGNITIFVEIFLKMSQGMVNQLGALNL